MEEGDKCLAENFAMLLKYNILIEMLEPWKEMGDLISVAKGPILGLFFRDFSVLIINDKRLEVLPPESIGSLIMNLYPFDDFETEEKRSDVRRLELN